MAVSKNPLPCRKLTLADKIKVGLVALPLAFIAPLALIISLGDRKKNWKRAIIDISALWMLSHLNRRQTRAMVAETRDSYNAYLKSRRLTPVIDELGEEARLLWVGPKITNRVILYFHGGAYLFGMIPSAPAYWDYVRENIEKKKHPVGSIGIAILNYTLVPDAVFPTQVRQAVLAVQYLLDSGVEPESIQIVGDSAGGLLIHQLLSHILHPIEGVPILSLSSPLAGVYMMSPWTVLADNPSLHTNEGQDDYLSASVLSYWGGKVLENAPLLAMPYLEASSVQLEEGWFNDISKLVNRVLISIGSIEVLRDACIQYGRVIEKHHPDTKILLDENGVHDEPFLPFLMSRHVKKEDQGNVTPFLIDWIAQNFSET